MKGHKAKPDSRWLVEWNHDEFWYPATVLAVDDSREVPLYVRFDDGDKQWCTREQLLPIDIEVGDRVHARWEDEEEFFLARVAEIKNDKYRLDYADGSAGWASLDMLRVTR